MVSHVGFLFVIRFALGVVESAVMPAMLVFLSHWFTKAERSRANTFLILGNPATVLWMSIVSGYLLESFGWRWMFILEGFPAVIWAFLWWKLVNDEPKDAGWLSKKKKQTYTMRCKKNKKELNLLKAIKKLSKIVLSFY